MIKSLIITTYLFVVLPLIVGASFALLIRHRKSFSFLYVSGYAMYLALFEILLAVQSSADASYSDLVKNWQVLTVVVSVVSVLIILVGLVFVKKRQSLTSLRPNSITQTDLITVFFTAVLVVFAVIFFVPSAQDQTPELARLALNSNSVFSIDPHTGVNFTDPSSYPGCLFLLYAMGSTLTGVDVTMLIHLFMPAFLIPFFVCCYTQISYILFPLDGQQKDRNCFVWLIILFYLLMTPFEAHLAFAPFKNIWNGITFASSCLLPLVFSICIDLIRHFSIRATESKPVISIFESILLIIMLSLDIMLCVRFGLALNGLILLAALGSVVAIWIIHKLSAKKGGAQ